MMFGAELGVKEQHGMEIRKPVLPEVGVITRNEVALGWMKSLAFPIGAC